MDIIESFSSHNPVTFVVLLLTFVVLVILCEFNVRMGIKGDRVKMIIMSLVFLVIFSWFIISTPESIVISPLLGISWQGALIAIGSSLLYLFIALMLNGREAIKSILGN